MGGKRDMESAQTLIVRGDRESILDLSCFDHYMHDGSKAAGARFSDKYSGDLLTLRTAVNELVRQALRPYLSNFSTTPAAAVSSVICGSMNTAWSTAKCTDVNVNNFISLANHRTTDRRAGCPGTRGPWTTAFTDANPAATTPPQPGGIDQLLTHRASIYPASPGDCSSMVPVLTGIIYRLGSSPTDYEDAVCTGVDCWYDASGGTCN